MWWWPCPWLSVLPINDPIINPLSCLLPVHSECCTKAANHTMTSTMASVDLFKHSNFIATKSSQCRLWKEKFCQGLILIIIFWCAVVDKWNKNEIHFFANKWFYMSDKKWAPNSGPSGWLGNQFIWIDKQTKVFSTRKSTIKRRDIDFNLAPIPHCVQSGMCLKNFWFQISLKVFLTNYGGVNLEWLVQSFVCPILSLSDGNQSS